MKKFGFFLAALVMAFAAIVTPADAQAAPTRSQVNSVISRIPASLVVKQTARLKDGRGITVYYKKAGNNIEIYSDSNLKGYTADDLLSLDSTTFSVTTSTSGKLIYSCHISKARRMLKQFVNNWL